MMFSQRKPIALPADAPPQLLVVVDTEEDFDWHAPPDRANNGVASMLHIDRVQTICNDYGLAPCYVVDYPVASQPDGYRLLKQYFNAGQCEIGAHLHPWVNPPFDEPVTVANTYPGNLPMALEREKLRFLRDQIAAVFGAVPTTYKAGRYGFGPHTEETLAALGFEIDVSVCPPFDHRGDGGPDYRAFSADPFWFGASHCLEIPLTGALVGRAGRYARPLYDAAQRAKRFKAPGILARLGLVDRLVLSPEGFAFNDHKRLTEFLLKQGVRTFTWSFHSPSVLPGCTPYVRNERDLQQFLERFKRFFDYFFNELGGQATTPTRLKAQWESLQ